MSSNLLEVGRAQANWNVSGTRVLKYTVEMSHRGLNEHKVLSAPDMDILQNKANVQARKWNEAWEIVEQRKNNEKEKEASIEQASILTQEAENSLRIIENILIHTLSIDDAVDWEKLKRFDDFSETKPVKPNNKALMEYTSEPKKETIEFTFFEKMFKSKKEKRITQNEETYKKRIIDWENEKKRIDEKNIKINEQNQENIRNWEIDVSEWEKRKDAFLEEREIFNDKIEQMKKSYLSCNPDSITEYCDMVLSNSQYPDTFPKTFEIEYVPDTKILIIEYQLPSQDNLPKLKEVKYIASKKELKETYISESVLTKMYDDTIYKISLRTIHEIFESDVVNAINAVSFNGWVKSINKGTGKEENNCILSIQVQKDEFQNIDLRNIDPKICFKSLKGVASSKLSAMTPVQPILQISKVDKRFVDAYEVADSIDSQTNLAAMDWEDFEHLVRELFEKEFQVNGGEVKVTQASRDGGVDAIAFDPDPIRGGKIVIQAKRYTNTVGVSAVRDLYGTTLNEGATKGILVSTADYGPDAYEFAKGKPLTLLNGSNLLHLLEKHGHHAKIDLREAKKILAEKEK